MPSKCGRWRGAHWLRPSPRQEPRLGQTRRLRWRSRVRVKPSSRWTRKDGPCDPPSWAWTRARFARTRCSPTNSARTRSLSARACRCIRSTRCPSCYGFSTTNRKSWRSAAKFLLYEDFFLSRLGGEAVISRCLASRTQMMDIHTGDWAHDLLARVRHRSANDSRSWARNRAARPECCGRNWRTRWASIQRWRWRAAAMIRPARRWAAASPSRVSPWSPRARRKSWKWRWTRRRLRRRCATATSPSTDTSSLGYSWP